MILYNILIMFILWRLSVTAPCTLVSLMILHDVFLNIKQTKTKKSFTARYKIHTLVYLETYEHIDAAITREKQLKNWSRANKIQLIESMNPEWTDLYDHLLW